MTPLEHYPELAEAIGVPDLYFKREDLHPYGSHKGRAIPHMIEEYYRDGDRRFALSSSGNAALAAILYVKELNAKKNGSSEESGSAHWIVDLDIFVGKNINPHKLEMLRTAAGGDQRIRISIEERPLKAVHEDLAHGARNLRQSTDDLALAGYESLAKELAEAPQLGAIFMGASSGTAAQALAEFFLRNRKTVQIHIVQTSAYHPISDAFGACKTEEMKSLADAVVDKMALRKNVLVPLIQSTGGFGWCATNDEIRAAQELVKKYTGLEISPNSALSVVGLLQAVKAKYPISGSVVCVISGE